ncbi:uncharacterized protein LOC113296836 isoform X1 [Papaver somniferum]|uniref:uncharacterized protein LOC113296836 isoform X1 n=1 Tax=Papaver somniferum TaxID=3469 RepID=UPI000E6F813A|nr:uncharacterized protein LOC113296836 isoform X1 [Papaver somniferum]
MNNGEAPGPSGQRVAEQDNDVSGGLFFGGGGGRRAHNVSVQTGEEFSMEFLQERFGTRKVNNVVPDLEHKDEKKIGGFDSVWKHSHVGYQDLTGILGLTRMDSECSYDIPNEVFSKGCVVDGDSKGYSDKASRFGQEVGVSGEELRRSTDDLSSYQAASGPATPSISVKGSPCAYQAHGSGTSDNSQHYKMKILCSFGGRILPRPGDGKLRYVGGETRIISIRTNISWVELVKKTTGICNQPHAIKYQLPGEDLDALISVSSDEDIQNMLEEYHGFKKVEGQRLRIFLISSSECENQSSFEARASEQNPSEYHYVVAVNGILDHSSPKISSTGQTLASQLSFNKDSVNSPKPSEIKDGSKPSNLSRNFFIAPQKLSRSPNHSPPFSPLALQQKDAMNGQKKLYNGQYCCNNESKDPYLKDQAPAGNYHHDTNIGCYGSPRGCVSLIHHHHHYLNKSSRVNFDQPNRAREVHFPDITADKAFVAPTTIVRNNSDLDGYSCERPMVKQRPFHSEKMSIQPEDPLCLLSGSNDSVGSHHGMPHAYSDSRLLEHGGGSYCFQEGDTPLSPLDLQAQSPAWVKSSARHSGEHMHYDENTDLPSPNFQNDLRSSLSASIVLERGTNSTKASHRREFSGGNEQIYWEDMQDLGGEKHQMTKEINLMSWGNESNDQETSPMLSLDMLDKIDQIDDSRPHRGVSFDSDSNSTAGGTGMPYKDDLQNLDHHQMSVGYNIYSGELHTSNTKVSASPVTTLGFCKDTAEEQSQGYYSSLINQVNGDLGSKISKIITQGSIGSCSKNSEASNLEKSLHQPNSDSSPTELPHGSSSGGLISFPSFVKEPGVVSQRESANSESLLLVSADLAPFGGVDNLEELLKLNMSDSSLTWDIFQNQNLATESPLGTEVVLPVSCSEEEFYKVDCRKFSNEQCMVENTVKVGTEAQNKINHHVQLEPLLILEDVTNSTSSSNLIPRVVDETTGDILTQRTTEAKSFIPESEDTKVDDRDKGNSISDSVIAEMEAGVYGLQIIKNADLEELRELGSGTFGTVYHGKWRGTDVAIKRLKKSCFAGRSSEQERMTNDFWREAKILSNLHHPNVVAFYGVVPDGVGGTLATVTEFMVNGSLRHVLLKKDKALDRRKKLIIAMDAAFGMEYLHLKNIVHFDLKCDNLLVNMKDPHRPICKVGDFGLSRIKRNTLVSGGVRGTLPWMAPELLNGSSSRVSEKVDVFSFGIAMWEILTGEEPYANMHCGAIIGGILNNNLRPTIPEQCDPEWRKLMEHCWLQEPTARPSFTEITSRLRIMSMAFQSKGGDQSPKQK